MNIKGIEKLTLLDYPGKLSCTVFLSGCNLRCPFCQNPGLVFDEGDNISEKDFFDFLENRKGKLDAVCISGGEPTLYNLEEFIKKIKDMGFLVKLDTNGTHPEKIKKLIEKNLIDYIATDLKNSFDKYPETVGIKGFDISPIKESMEIILSGNGFTKEFRTTVIKDFHNVESIKTMAELTCDADVYALQKFRYGDLIGTRKGMEFSEFSDSDYERLLSEAKKINSKAVLRG